MLYSNRGTVQPAPGLPLLSHREGYEDRNIFHLLSETHTISQSLSEYEGQKSNSITAARRLGELVGEDVVKDK
jgi:DNA polymerase epsilon subunit 1